MIDQRISSTGKALSLAATVAMICTGLGYSHDVRAADAAAASGEGTLEEVIVTASRREENLQKSAIAIDVVGGDAISSGGISQPESLNKLVPGLKMTNGNVTSIYVRGVGENSTNANTQSAVAFNVDGVYVGRTTAVAGNIFDVQRVEVLKGPQGTLYGRNASGGAVNVISNKPTQDFGGSASIELGDYNLRRSQGTINLPVTDTFALRLALYDSKRDGYNDDNMQDENTRAARLHALWKPNDKVSLLITAEGARVGGLGDGSVFVPGPLVNKARQGTGPQSPFVQQLQATGTNANGVPYRILPTLGQLGSTYNNRRFSAELNYDLGFATLTVLPAYRHQTFTQVNVGTTGGGTNSPGEASQYTGEVRLGKSTGDLKYVVGAYYFNEKVNYTYHILNLQNGAPLNSFQQIPVFNTDSKALFTEDTYSFTNRFRVTLGARYTREQRDFEMHTQWYGRDFLPGPGKSPLFSTAVDPNLGGAPTGFYTYDNVATPVFTSTTGKAGFEFDVAADSMVYLTVATGFKSGGFSISPPPNNVFQPEKLTAFTLGSKNRFFDNRVQANVEAFYWKYKNQQVAHLGYDVNGAAGFVTDNAGAATIKGLNGSFQWAVTRHDNISLEAEYLSAYYDEYKLITPFPSSVGCKFTPIVFNGLNQQVQDCSGFRMPFTPNMSGTLSYTRTFDLNSGGTIVVIPSAQAASAQRLGIDARPAFQGKAYFTPDLDVAYHAKGDAWSLAAYVRNINDSVIYNSVQQATFDNRYFTANIRPPRTYGLRLAAKF
jgi:iron complex outermembrane receptor protein